MTYTIPVKFPDGTVEKIDRLIHQGRYLSRSDFIRHSARVMLEIETGIFSALSDIRGILKTQKTPLEHKREAESEAMKEIEEKLRRTSDASP